MRGNADLINLSGDYPLTLALQGLHGPDLPQECTGMGNRGTQALNRAAKQTVITDNTLAGASLKCGERFQRNACPNAQLNSLDNAQLRQRVMAIAGPVVDSRGLEDPEFLVIQQGIDMDTGELGEDPDGESPGHCQFFT